MQRTNGEWTENWFYVGCLDDKGWPRHSIMSSFLFDAFPRISRSVGKTIMIVPLVLMWFPAMTGT